MKKSIILLLLSLILILQGCAWFDSSSDMEKNSDQLVAEGTSSFVDGDYKNAVKAYSDLKDWYPFSKYAILAELKIADAHYELEEYDKAIFAYEEFESLHPKNKAIPYVIYKTGLCWFDQIDSVDRDDTPAKKSLEQFTRLIDQYPESPFAEKANKKIRACVENIAGHELYIADFYFKTKQYKAALKRYEYLVANYPGTKQGQEALKKIPACMKLVKNN